MYRDVAQWSSIRHRILQDGISIRQVVRETGISRKTVRKMLDQPLPKPYGPRAEGTRSSGHISPRSSGWSRRRRAATLGPDVNQGHLRAYPRPGGVPRQLSIRDGLRAASDGPYQAAILEYAYDLLVSLEKSRAIDFLFLLSRVDPPVVSAQSPERFFRSAGRMVSVTPKPDEREQARQAAFEWMRAVLQ